MTRQLADIDLQRRFSEVLDQVEAGEVVVITRVGRVIAQLEPAGGQALDGDSRGTTQTSGDLGSMDTDPERS